MKKIYTVLVLFLIVSLSEVVIGERCINGNVFKYDASGYYLYLPATIIHNDLAHLKFYEHIDSVYHPSDKGRWYAISEHPVTKRKFDKYAIGISIGELPFFLIAHAYCMSSHQYPADGYSIPYQTSAALSTIAWVLIGLLVLGKFLMRFFDENTTSITLLLIAFGTNLYCSTSVDMGMSHALVFALYSGILFCTERLYAHPNSKYAILLGLLFGWIIISRPVDIAIAILPILWPIAKSEENSSSRLMFFRKNYKQLSLCLLSCMLVTCIQLFYWKYTTGHFLYYSYEGEGFDFKHSKIIDGLFSYRKGWFLYTPIAFAGMLGLIPLFKYQKKLLLPIILFFSTIIYIIFCWWMWMYGYSFGCRALVEALAVLAIPLAAMVHFVRTQRWLIKTIGIALSIFFIWLNIYQTHQYIIGTLDGYRMTKEYYWRIFDIMHASDEDRKYLLP
jgi:hypothetical protein